MSSSSSSSPPGEYGKLYMEEGMLGGMVGGTPGGIVEGKPACMEGEW